MKKNKIIHFHPNGKMASIFIKPLVNFENSLDYESIVVSSSSYGNFQDKVIRYDLGIKNIFFLPLAFIQICIFLLQIKPDLIISHNSKSSLLPLLASTFVGIRRRVYFNHGVPHIAYKNLLGFLLRTLEKINLRLASSVLTVSNDMRLELLRLKDETDISIVGFGSASGIQLPLVPNDDRIISFKDKYKIVPNDFIVVFVGRPEIRKGISVILDLWINHLTNTRYKLFLCGPNEIDVKKIIGYIPSNIFCLGFSDEVPHILHEANCLILPSLHEGLSYAVLESMASKCVVIANNIPGVRELIVDGVSGFLIDDNRIDGYLNVIDYLVNIREQDLKKIKESAFLTAEKYSRDLFLQAYRQTLLRLLAN
jgi:glycosyltransferase involved in cell wall biosynthesis